MKNRYPNAEELYALELDARRLRAAEMARMLKALAHAVRRMWVARPAKGLRHA